MTRRAPRWPATTTSIRPSRRNTDRPPVGALVPLSPGDEVRAAAVEVDGGPRVPQDVRERPDPVGHVRAGEVAGGKQGGHVAGREGLGGPQQGVEVDDWWGGWGSNPRPADYVNCSG